MTKIEIFDGTRENKYGKTLNEVLEKLSNFGTVLARPTPGGYDIRRYKMVQALVRKNTHPYKNQVNIKKLIRTALQYREFQDPNSKKIILMEKDAYSEGINWCFGMYTQQQGKDFIVVSTNRIRHKSHFFDLLAHEIGHMYGAAPAGRANTKESLGSHCLNELCVMQQKLTIQDAIDYAKQRKRFNAPLYCHQCIQDLTLD